MGRGRTSGVGRKGRIGEVLTGLMDAERQARERLEAARREEYATRVAAAEREMDALAARADVTVQELLLRHAQAVLQARTAEEKRVADRQLERRKKAVATALQAEILELGKKHDVRVADIRIPARYG